MIDKDGRFDLARMLREIKEEGDKFTASKALSQEEIQKLIAQRKKAAAQAAALKAQENEV
mgnify:CR=1 FL=1